MVSMSEAQTTTQLAYSKRHRAGVAKREDLILTGIEDLPGAVQCILAERQRNDPQQDVHR
jgi:hypothetical protein